MTSSTFHECDRFVTIDEDIDEQGAVTSSVVVAVANVAATPEALALNDPDLAEIAP